MTKLSNLSTGSVIASGDLFYSAQVSGSTYNSVKQPASAVTTFISTNTGHIATGNFASINNPTFAPGDPVNATPFSYQSVSIINEFVTGDLTIAAPLQYSITTNYVNYRHTGIGTSRFFGVDYEPTISSNSTGPWSQWVTFLSASNNFGSGNITTYRELWVAPTHAGSGTVATFEGIFSNCFAQGGNISTMKSFRVSANVSSGIITEYRGISLEFIKTGGTVTTGTALYISDHSSLATTSFNLHSVGSTAVNLFDGIIRLGTATDASPTDGDLWFDGTHLNFRHGGVTTPIV